ncbi:hypothetical protein FDC06_08670 [Clostridium botulinum]|uniref:Uncharacterized protein n=1 Tax=Clostridium botulinum (strain Hall / ATCC 3502 / NCTC 13319 / Type A) TaxID=441771 RepID=A5HZT6_CLOBH|nr:hypothetical protein DB732_04120 [Clostridium botulinum]CAL82296.1 hypothetical protein CBO0743 [Clostridium botulinum A str. ATCC 3502]AWB29482.1 hypothetical protein DBN47_04135 [Clostridium botulinum]EGT5613961.1 hypothetical protein [Clostridium botulinum]EGT5620662.1 hypothetical protein [Clostridium botulinum]
MASPRRQCVNYIIKFNLLWCVGDPKGILKIKHFVN